MREILFRGKRKDNGEWVYGDLVRLKDGQKSIPHIYGFGEILPQTVGQFTGLTDGHGKRIFEGDIIQRKNNRYVIKYADGITSFMAKAQSDSAWTPCVNRGTMKGYEVVGNIHDNPELLEATK